MSVEFEWKPIRRQLGAVAMLGHRSSEKPKSANLPSEITQNPIEHSQLLVRSLQPHQVDSSSNFAKIPRIKIVPEALRSTKPAPVLTRSPIDSTQSMQVILPEHLFLGMLCLERKRSERSRKNFLLILVHTENGDQSGRKIQVLKGMIKAADAVRRETDPAGWYAHDAVLGIIFTELGTLDEPATAKKLLQKVNDSLDVVFNPEDRSRVHVSSHVFPDNSKDSSSEISVNPALYPDVLHMHDSKRVSQTLKRAMDVIGSAAALLVCSPLLLVIAAATKLSSQGPIFFKQERLGRFGTTFKCLKVRSMYVGNDPKIHREFMKGVIGGSHDGKASGGNEPSYKMTNDPRITRIGRILRRTSLDELPQFINVLMGDMSLVGPRPPLVYEYAEYDVWHRRRVLEVKPGITGLWQVNGRSHIQFNEMVRLDLQYARGWSLWRDIQIIMRTPRAVVFGGGAY
jgi:lipopolysaccharide/colanic/teichoic acid biosynthesis glycosyltransferase